MTTLSPQGCPTCNCDDSLLSVIANVLGIFTFALGVVAYMVAFTAVTRGAAEGIEDTKAALDRTSDQFEQTRLFFERLQNESVPEVEMLEKLMRDSINGLAGVKLEAGVVLDKFSAEKRGTSRGLVIPSRLKWWYYEKDVEAAMAKLRELQQHIVAVQQILIER